MGSVLFLFVANCCEQSKKQCFCNNLLRLTQLGCEVTIFILLIFFIVACLHGIYYIFFNRFHFVMLSPHCDENAIIWLQFDKNILLLFSYCDEMSVESHLFYDHAFIVCNTKQTKKRWAVN